MSLEFSNFEFWTISKNENPNNGRLQAAASANIFNFAWKQFWLKLVILTQFQALTNIDDFFLTISENLDCNDLIDEFEKKRKEKNKKEADKRKSAPSGGSESKKKKVR